jgi:hypothetical protein
MITTKDFDLLESEISEKKVSLSQLKITYRNFILRILTIKPLRNAADNILLEIISFFKSFPNTTKEKQISIKKRLWELAIENEKNNPSLYYLARCAILIYGEESEWEAAQDQPIFYFLMYAQKIFPDIEAEFVEFFRQHLFRLSKNK